MAGCRMRKRSAWPNACRTAGCVLVDALTFLRLPPLLAMEVATPRVLNARRRPRDTCRRRGVDAEVATSWRGNAGRAHDRRALHASRSRRIPSPDPAARPWRLGVSG